MPSNLTEHGAAFLYLCCCVSYYRNNLNYWKDECSVSSEMIGYNCQVNHMKQDHLWASSCCLLIWLFLMSWHMQLFLQLPISLAYSVFLFFPPPKTQACRELSQHRYQQVNEKLPMQHCWDFIDLILYAYFFHLNILQEKSR